LHASRFARILMVIEHTALYSGFQLLENQNHMSLSSIL